MIDYRYTLSGIRRFNQPDVYKITLEFQKQLASHGIAWHNPFSNECTVDFCCCKGDGKYNAYFPSYEEVIKQFCSELFEETKHGDEEHQKWLKNKIDTFRKKFFNCE